MKTSTALHHFNGSRRELARAIDRSVQAVYLWGDIVPVQAAIKLEKVTGGKLKLDKRLYA